MKLIGNEWSFFSSFNLFKRQAEVSVKYYNWIKTVNIINLSMALKTLC